MKIFRFEGAMRYTRWSCRPFGARFEISEFVQAMDRADALRQVGLCLNRDLEEILSQVNAINVSEVRVETDRLATVDTRDNFALWNPSYFSIQFRVPPHIELPPG